MVACSRKVGKYEHLPLAEIDTMTLKPGVKSILRKYIKAHPKYQTLLLEQKNYPLKIALSTNHPINLSLVLQLPNSLIAANSAFKEVIPPLTLYSTTDLFLFNRKSTN